MKKGIYYFIACIFVLSISSCGNDCPPIKECDTSNLQQEIADLKNQIQNQPNEAQIISDYFKEKETADSYELLNKVKEADLSMINLESFVDVTDKSISNLLTYGGGAENIDFIGSQVKRIFEDSPLIATKLSKAKNLQILYSANKLLIQSILPFSKMLKETYRDAEIIAHYYEGNLNSKRKKVLQDYFDAHDGEPISYAYNWVYINQDNNDTLKALIIEFDDNPELAGKHYLVWLSAKRQQKRFGSIWTSTMARILGDFGEIE